MRYGKSEAQQIDPTLRRRKEQKLKSAAPGAPFGWCADGTPYIGTQYCIKASKNGLQFASLSTRNGSAQYYWKALSTVSSKVALSALETHGRVESLLANESRLPIGDVLDAEQVAAVRAVFSKLLGKDTLQQMEAAGEEADAADKQVAGDTPSGIGVKAEVGEGSTSLVGAKRLARMEAADAISAASEAKKAKSEPRTVD